MKKMLMAMGLAGTVFLAGCAGTTGGTSDTGGTAPAAAAAHSGFLADYSKLGPVEGKEGVLRYLDRSADLRPYTKLYLDPVQVFVSTEGEAYKGIQPEALKRMADSFHASFVSAVRSGYQVVGAPGPDVLRVRLAITGMQPVPTPLGVTDFIPIKAVFNVGRAAAGASPRLAEMSAEMEVLDGQSRQVAAAVVTRKSDKTLSQNDRITWNELQPIVNAWAGQFRQGLDDLRGVGRR